MNVITEEFHANVNVYQAQGIYTANQAGWDGWGKWHSDYMRCTIPNGKGVDPRAFLSKNDNLYGISYKVVYGDTTPHSYSKTEIGNAKISLNDSFAYTGKPIEPDVNVYYNGKTLAKGTDYTLTYVKYIEVGTAAVIVNGTGQFTGKYCCNFRIVPDAPSLSVAEADGKCVFTWTPSAAAVDKYEIFASDDGGKSFLLLNTTEGSVTSCTLNSANNSERLYKIRGSYLFYPITFNGEYSSATKANTGDIIKDITISSNEVVVYYGNAASSAVIRQETVSFDKVTVQMDGTKQKII